MAENNKPVSSAIIIDCLFQLLPCSIDNIKSIEYSCGTVYIETFDKETYYITANKCEKEDNE